MAAHVLRLRLALLVGALRGDRRHVVRMVVALLALAAALVVAALAALSLASAATQTTLVVSVLAGSAVTLGFAVGPLVTGAADPMDPRRFGVIGIAPRPLAAILGVAGLLSVPTIVLLVLAVCLAVALSSQGVPPVVAAISVVLGVVTCSLLARIGQGVAAMFLRERRSRELTGLFLVAVLAVVVPIGVFLGSLEWGDGAPVQLIEATRILAYTPLGAAWALPAASLVGGSGVIVWFVAIATVLVLAGVWALLVGRMLTVAERPASTRERGGLGWFAVAPGTPGGAIAARSLVYWTRDKRYLVNLVVIPVAGALTVIPLLIAGVPLEIVVLVPVPLMALFFGWLPHNDIAYDSTAIWMHVASGVRGAADRFGRLIPVLLVGLPVLAVLTPVAIALHDRWALLPALVGVVAALFLGGLGLSSLASVMFPYAVTPPGDSPFQQPQRAGSGIAGQVLVMAGAVLAAAPALWWSWLALSEDIEYATAAFWAGLGFGVGLFVVGISVGAALFERRGDRIMEFAESV